ncbi:ribosomal RNA large subunit methyltransferase H [Bacteroidia bacterium]|nr:ribosomal RNA large subunit methyltransferase H [Bacteroidia bacterium]
MKIVLLMIGKTGSPLYNELIAGYEDRLKRYLPFSITALPDIKKAKSLPLPQLKSLEGELIIRSLQPGDCCVLLDEGGKEYSSTGFSTFLAGKMNAGCKRLVFAIGGAYGFGDNVYALAPEKLSLSRMTFSHQMVRLVFIEQLYRAFTILNNEPYHHE